MSKRVLGFGLAWVVAAWAGGPWAAAQSLGLGDDAPKLEVKEFVKGEAVSKFEKGKTYVVEFWATWCGPCKTSIPHVSELQKKYPDVTFIGVSVWEQDQTGVKPFVKEMGDKMAYRVAMDSVPEDGKGNEGKMAKGWMTAAGENGIPSSFIINGDGKVAWIGHPMEMDKPLEKVAAGKYDLEAAVKERKEAKNAQNAFMKLRGKLVAAQQSDDPKTMIKVLDEAFAETPALEAMLGSLKFTSLVKAGESKDALAYGDKLYDKTKDDSNGLNNLAWAVVDPANKKKPSGDLVKFALKAAERADEIDGGKNPAVADTLAKAQFDTGDPVKAYETQKRAMKYAEGTPLVDQGMRERLEQYKKAAAEGGKDKSE